MSLNIESPFLARRLDAKLQIGICLALALSAYVMVNVELPPWSHIISAFSVVAFAIPTLMVLRLWLGVRDALIMFAVLGVYALGIELLAITTGFPYGHFNYSNHLGYRLFGEVPWTVAFAWPPLMLGACAAGASLSKSLAGRLLLSALSMVAFDLVLDPGAVALRFWSYPEGGWFYGVPASNFAGWLITSVVGAMIVELILRQFKPLLAVPVQLMTPAILIVFFWSAIAIFANLYLAFAVAMGVQLFLAFIQSRYGYDFDDMLVLVDENDHPIATAPKLETHDSDTPLHRAFSVFIFDRDGRVLLQQRAMEKKTWPGVWSNSCCGHVMLHESTEDAAARRLKYELGLRGIDLRSAVPEFRYRAEKDGIVENEICPVYVGSFHGDPKPNPSEVADIRWTPWSEFVAMVEDPANGISPWATDEVRLLEKSDVFKEWFRRSVSSSGAI